MEEDRIECAGFGVRPWDLKEERWNNLRQKAMILGRKGNLDEISQTDDRADGPDASETQTGHMETQSGATPRIM